MTKKKSTRVRANLTQRPGIDLVASPFQPGELPRLSTAEPSAVRMITKLNQNSMVWAYDGVATEVEAMGPFTSVLSFIMSAVVFWISYECFFDGNHGSFSIERTVYAPVLSICGLCIIGFAIYYGDLHFKRKTGKIYSRENNVRVQMDWEHVRPYALLGVGPVQFGAPPLMSLILVEAHPNQPNAWRAKMTAAGPLPNRHSCQEVWELIRRYMEEPPETLPQLEVVPGGRTWISALLEFGPLTNYLKSTPDLIAEFRDNNWWPIITPVNVLWWIIAWPFPLSTTLYARYRPKAELPKEWTAQEEPPQCSDNPYRITDPAAAEAAGRRKAAWVIGLTSGICILIGIRLWAYPLGLLWTRIARNF